MDNTTLTYIETQSDKFNIIEGKKLASVIRWLENVINSGLSTKQLTKGSLMPKKSQIAELLNVGLGTVQNAYRILEDRGLLISKQSVGTFIADENIDKIFRKLTSKKDIILNSIKKHFKKNNLKKGDRINSVRYYSDKMKVSTALILQVFEQLEDLGIITNNNGVRILSSTDFTIEEDNKATLSDKIYDDLKKYILSNQKIGDKIPSVAKLSKMFFVSPKTIHSAIKKLESEGVLLPLNGQYGTVVLKLPQENVFYQKPETSIFASSKETYYYHYEKILDVVKKMIFNNFEIGSKLPSISELALFLDVNPNTIRKTFEILRQEGIVSSSRGRYGGTFVLELPDIESNQSYQWLAVNSDFSI